MRVGIGRLRLKGWLAGAACAALLAPLPAQAETPKEIADLFGRADAIGDPEISPDGKFLAVICSPEVKPSICVFDLNGGPSIVIPAIADVRLENHYWVNNDTLIMNVEFFESVKTSSGVKDYAFQRAIAFNLKDKKPVMLMNDNRGYVNTTTLAAIKPDDPEHVIFSLVRESTASGNPIYTPVQVNLKSGRSRALNAESDFSDNAVHLPGGKIVATVYFKTDPSGNRVWIEADNKTLWERRNTLQVPIQIWGLDASGENLVVFIEGGEPFGLHAMSLKDGKLKPIDVKTADDSGLISPLYDRRTNKVIGIEISDDMTTHEIDDPTLKAQVAGVRSAMKGASVTLVSWTDDRAMSVMAVEHPGKPVDYFLFENATGALSPVGNDAPHLEGRTLGKVEKISYKASDGLEIEGFLTLPPGKTKADGPFPLILMPHGGPEARDTLTFDWWTQAYATAGYAVLQPNFRGSSGYGYEFLEAGYGEFGGKMVSDVLDGADWAVAQGYAKSGNVCAVGASYGGYSALMMGLDGASRIKCVVAINALTHPSSFLALRREGSFSENYWERYLGGDVFNETRMRALSPTTRAGEYKVPVQLIASKEDSTVPFSQSEGFIRSAKAGGKATLVTLEGEDHFMRTTRARYDVLNASLAFLQTHLPTK